MNTEYPAFHPNGNRNGSFCRPRPIQNLAPRIVNTFIESGDFAGKTVIPFATSGSSSISNAEKELQTNYPGINWGKGRLLNGASRETVKQWIKK